MKIIVLASGGIDSTVLLCWLKDKGHDVHALSVNYGQKNGYAEINAADDVARVLQIRHRNVDLSALGEMLGSALTTPGSVKLPLGYHPEDPAQSATVVPNRNMLLLSVAIARAVAKGFDAVAYGAHEGDAAVYADCRPEFRAAMHQAAQVCGEKPVAVEAPFIGYSKRRVVEIGLELGAPFDLTWSCYRPGEKHCGRCGACLSRAAAFGGLGRRDPVEHEA